MQTLWGEETIHIHYYSDAVVMVKEGDDIAQEAIETTLASETKNTVAEREPVDLCAIGTCLFGLFLVLSCIALQLYIVFNPPIVTVTILPKSQAVTLSGTLQFGRVLSPITLSQSQTVPTTGKGHQDARQATGTVTFYNGLFTSQTVALGTILTGSDGVQVITDQTATIPAGNPPAYGQVTVSAHAINPGVRGNIPTDGINQLCCANAVLAKNTTPFYGGKDERDFQTVTTHDINAAAEALKTTLSLSIQGAFQGQLKNGEAFITPTCTPSMSSDHQPGQEATQVHVTVSETCNAVAYDKNALLAKTTALLSSQAMTELGREYSLRGTVHITSIQATGNNALAFTCQGTWVYALADAVQAHIKSLITGKTKQEALHTMAHLPGIQQVTIEDLDDHTRVPKNPASIHLVILEQLGSQAMRECHVPV